MAELNREYNSIFIADGGEAQLSVSGASFVGFFQTSGSGTYKIQGAVSEPDFVDLVGMSGLVPVVGTLTEVVNGGAFSQIKLINTTGGVANITGYLVAFWN